MRPSCERRRLCYAPLWTLTLGTSALALSAVHRRMRVRALAVAMAWTDWASRASPPVGPDQIHEELTPRSPARPLLGSGVVGRVRRRGRRGLALEPLGLGIHLGKTHPAAGAPGTGDGAGRTAEVGDHLSGAATGHTLPRPVGPLRLIFAVVCLACHEAMRLAFRA